MFGRRQVDGFHHHKVEVRWATLKSLWSRWVPAFGFQGIARFSWASILRGYTPPRWRVALPRGGFGRLLAVLVLTMGYLRSGIEALLRILATVYWREAFGQSGVGEGLQLLTANSQAVGGLSPNSRLRT